VGTGSLTLAEPTIETCQKFLIRTCKQARINPHRNAPHRSRNAPHRNRRTRVNRARVWSE